MSCNLFVVMIAPRFFHQVHCSYNYSALDDMSDEYLLHFHPKIPFVIAIVLLNVPILMTPDDFCICSSWVISIRRITEHCAFRLFQRTISNPTSVVECVESNQDEYHASTNVIHGSALLYVTLGAITLPVSHV